MRTLFLDTETYSEVPIRHGTHRYAEGVEVMLVAIAVDDSPVEVWDTQDLPNWREALQREVDKADRVVMHNSHFDRTVLRHAGVHVPTDKITDTMVLALQHALPGGLGDLCDVLEVPQDKAKDKAGKKLIQLFCKPTPRNWKIRRATRDTHPAEWAEFIEYARLDVDAMRDLLGRIPRWNYTAGERTLWLLDQDINDRGFATDKVLAAAAKRAFARASGALASRASALTGDAVTSLTQRGKVLDYATGELGLDLPDLTKGTIADALKDEDLDPEARELLELRQQAAATSPAKYDVILNATSADGRLRGSIQFCGASRTGRDAGRLFQPQNLPRPTMEAEEIEAGILALKLGCEDLIYDNVSELCANAVRGVIVAEPGNKLLVSDLSNIEGRVLAWLAGEYWKIEAFEDYDAGRGPDIYKLTAARILNKDHSEVTKLERQNHGKVPELACGYQGSVGAFNTMGKNYGVELPEDRILEIVRAWRARHPKTRALWYDVEAAAKRAVLSPAESFKVRDLVFDVADGYLRMRLPSGRYLCYKEPTVGMDCYKCEGGKVIWSEKAQAEIICPNCHGSGREDEILRFYGINQYTRKWQQLETYGGKLVENAVQAIARDVFLAGMRRAEEAGYKVVLRVHDELVCEVPDDPAYTVEALDRFLTTHEHWNGGLPLAAAGHEMYRYAKGD